MSDEVQRLVRKLQPAGPRSFDEHTWPIYVAVVVLCGYLCGVALSLSNFDDPRLHANAITWLVAIAVAGGLALWSVSFLRRSILRRTLVFSILLSLIINISLFVIMAWTTIFHSPWNKTEPKAVTARKKQDVIVPEYPLFNDKQQQRVPQDHERPVETGEPEAEKRIELTRQSTQPEPQAAELPSAPSSSNADQRVVTKPHRADVPSAPRQHEALAKLSRQPLQADLNISRQPSMPAQPTRAAKLPQQVASSDTSVAPQKPATLEAPAMPEDSNQAPQQVQVAKLTRQTESDRDSQIASLPTLKRRLNRPRELPKTETPVEYKVSRSQAIDSTVEADSTLMTKRSTSAPEHTAVVDLQPKVATNFDRQSQLDRPETETLSPSLTRADLANASTARTEVQAAASQATESNSDAADLDAAATEVAQQQSEGPAKVLSHTADTPQTADLAPSAQAIARSRSDAQPSVSKSLSDLRSPVRANRLAQRAASIETEAVASVEASFDSSNPSPASEPSRMALSRSSVGVAGVGDASNLERGVAAPDSPISIASASANRPRATQNLDPGPALSPRAPSLTRRLRANSNSPKTSMQAQPIDRAMVAGANAPAAEATSSSATLERALSNAPSAATTAAKGTAEIDLGPTRIAADTGDGRAEGGGQPEIASGELPRALPRENSVAGKTGIRTATRVANPTSPAAQDVAPNANETATAAGTKIARSTDSNAAAGGGPAPGETGGPKEGEIRVARARGERANSTDPAIPSLASGGTSSPGRRSRALRIKTTTNSQVPQLAGDGTSGGSRRGDPLDAQGAQPQRSSAGLLVDNVGEFGAAAGDLSVDGSPDNLPAPSFSRTDRESADSGDSFAVANQNLGAPRRDRRANISGSSTNVELDPEDFAVNVPDTNQDDEALDGMGQGTLVANATPREPGGSLQVDFDTLLDDGGLGDTPSIDSGIISRTANDDSELVSLQPARFLRRTRPGAVAAAKTDVVSPTKAFRRRVIRKGEELAGERGLPSPKTEASIELGLVFLSRFQSADGSWSFNNFADGRAELPEGEDAVMVSDAAATGLALLSFLGAGYHHRADKYQEHVKNGIDFLVQHQKEDGDLYIDQDANSSRSAWMYSHAIATIALCEAYGMTQDPELRAASQKAINFIIESQHPSRGGWRYSPAYGTDTSVSGWMTMALKSAELAELNVPKSVYVKVEHWLDLAQDSDTRPYLYRYNPYAPDTERQQHGRRPTRAITAVGLLMRLYTGWRRDDVNMILGARTLAQNAPELGTSSRPRRDTYYWYYATQVMYHMGGEYWESWNQALHPMLTSSQIKQGALSGSWNPQAPIPDRWGAYGGRLYVTTLNLLSLEVFYRHLPLYEETSK